MARPLLELEQEWHRQRAQLRAGAQRPPPLVTAGLELFHDLQATSHTRVQVAGMALIFGLFPTTVAEFFALMRHRLQLGSKPSRQELQSVLGTRIQALWAWLPTLQQDCYGEMDHATDEARLWLIGPGAGELREIDLERERESLDAAFLAALVMNGSRHWGGQAGLAQLVQRFGVQNLLVAAQVAEALEREPHQPGVALELARTRWPQLEGGQGAAWEALSGSEPAWACVQLGRLALRLGLDRPAYRLLSEARQVEAGATAWRDLAVASERQGDLTSAESAWATVTQRTDDDLDAWRRLLLVRLRLALFREAGDAIRQVRALGGTDVQLVSAMLGLLRRPRMALLERAHLVGWCAGHLAPALAEQATAAGLLAEIVRDRPPGVASRIDASVADLRGELTNSTLRVLLLALPFLGGEIQTLTAGQVAAHALLACRIWSEQVLGQGQVPDSETAQQGVLALARLALDRQG